MLLLILNNLRTCFFLDALIASESAAATPTALPISAEARKLASMPPDTQQKLVPKLGSLRNAGYIGLDRFALSGAWRQRHFSKVTDHASHRRTTVPAPALTH